jgi:hypothetical protein
MTKSKYTVHDHGDYWTLVSSNGKVLATSGKFTCRSGMSRVMDRLVNTLKWGCKYTEAPRIIKKG